jgi:class 3 adenylate cyclase
MGILRSRWSPHEFRVSQLRDNDSQANADGSGARDANATRSRSRLCSQCREPLPAEYRFCGHCGAAAPAQAALPAAEAEHRPLTIVFCDLVGSTSLSARLDPEELRSIIARYQRACADVVQRFDGHIAQYLGDGLLIYFGYPVAHEDDAARAVRASLAMVEAARDLGAKVQDEIGAPIAVRIGVHSGPVVAGELGAGARRENLAIGRTPNVAARIQGLAQPNTVWISQAVVHLIQGFFVLEDQGPHALKGIAEPVPLWRVLGETAARNRFDTERARGLVPLVNRTDEMAAIDAAFARARSGRLELLLVRGDAGIGKSRLLEEFRAKRSDRVRWWHCECSPVYDHAPFYPLSDQPLAPGIARDQLRAWLQTLEGQEPAGNSQGRLLEVRPETPSPTPNPQRRREVAMQALLALVRHGAQDGTLVLALEDLQWLDPSTEEFLHLLEQQCAELPALVLLTARRSWRPPERWQQRVSELEVEHLDPAHGAQLAALVGRERIGDALLQGIVARADGVPIFIEELTKAVAESAESGSDLAAIPETLQASLMARLDGGGPAKRVAQLASVIGREFPHALLQGIAGLSPEVLGQALEILCRATILERCGQLPSPRLRFRHALLRDAAYGSLLRRERAQLHGRLADVMCEDPERHRARPEGIAFHLAEAGRHEESLPYWLAAARADLQRFANLEAIAQVERGLASIARTKPSAAGELLELGLRSVQGAALITTRGYGAPEVRTVFDRALELSSRVGEAADLFRTLAGLWMYYVVRAELREAHALAARLLALAQAHDRPELVMVAEFATGFTHYHHGAFEQAREHLERALVPVCDVGALAAVTPTNTDPRVNARAFLGCALWHVGCADRGLLQIEEAIAAARQTGHPYTQAYALLVGGNLRELCGDYDGMLAWAHQALALASEQKYPYLEALAHFEIGAARLARARRAVGSASEIAEARRMVQSGIEACDRTGARMLRTYLLACFARHSLAAGEHAATAAILGQLDAAQHDTEELAWLAEFHRLTAEHARSDGALPDALADGALDAAAAVAERQGSRGLALRAALSSARLAREPEQRERAYQRLQEVHSAIAGGSDTEDCREAGRLLGARSTGAPNR